MLLEEVGDGVRRVEVRRGAAAVRERLAAGPSAQIPLRAGVPRPDKVLDVSDLQLAEVDWAAASAGYEAQADALESLFNR